MVGISVSSEKGRGFSWMSPERMIHKSRLNVVAVLFHLDLYSGRVVGLGYVVMGALQVVILQVAYRHAIMNKKCSKVHLECMVHGASHITSLNYCG